jgi:hypothetical protein
VQHLLIQVQELQRDLDAARGVIEVLRAQREEVERDLRAARAATQSAACLYARVGLVEAAPDWLVVATQRAYRIRFHPDRHPNDRKAEAERTLKAAEEVFFRIASKRGVRPETRN